MDEILKKIQAIGVNKILVSYNYSTWYFEIVWGGYFFVHKEVYNLQDGIDWLEQIYNEKLNKPEPENT